MLNAQLYNCQCALPMSLSIRVSTHPEIFSCVSVREYQRVWALCVCWSVRDYNSLKSIQWNSTNTHGFALAHTAHRIQTHIHTCAELLLLFHSRTFLHFVLCIFLCRFLIGLYRISHECWCGLFSTLSITHTHTESVLCLDLHIDGRRVTYWTELTARKPNRTE